MFTDLAIFDKQQQERLGLWSIQVSDPVGRREGLHTSDFDQYGSDHILQPVWCHLLVLGQEIQGHYKGLVCP